jgi:hypothetical protein
MELKKVGLLCSEGIANGLMMMVASHRLMCEGARVITFHNRLHELSPWFGEHDFAFRPNIEDVEAAFAPLDLLIVQYDSSPYTKEVIQILSAKQNPKLSIFYPTYSKYTHPKLTPIDRIFDKNLPMVDNIAIAISSILQLNDHSKNNGLLPPQHLLHRRYRKRVAILPSSQTLHKYQKIADDVSRYGFNPLLLDSQDLSLGASIIYESGYFIGPESDLCHLASNLQIPTLVVSGNKKPLGLWRPGWLRSSYITKPRWVPHALEHFITTRRVLSGFLDLAAKEHTIIKTDRV